jgi:hypothetical protein
MLLTAAHERIPVRWSLQATDWDLDARLAFSSTQCRIVNLSVSRGSESFRCTGTP